ncbi:hypothetical protein PN441_03665 [Spirulina major CS-329]|uniref:hypothetical protein n=1 Tax=Spirulina TaxID=1154 RepID=UPI00232B37E3|nr:MULTISPECIES: hypothetical protein [Spirulina]MDB9496609.1 hypothetical protein [Spirulina subsalsa CS-330]MDB9502156.1 hypothetical protein [Spirulina major CS-329]
MPNLHKSTAGPLSIGNVINATVTLYRTHWRPYLSLSFQSSAWILIPLVIGAFGVMAALATDAPELWFGAIPFWMGGAVYCWGRSLIAVGAITRLAVEALQEREETVPTAYRWARSRLWGLIGATFLLGLLFFVAYVGLSFIFLVGGVLIAALFGVSLINLATTTTIEPETAVLIGLTILGVTGLFLLAILSLFFWIGARLFIYDVPIIAETESSATRTLGTSWQLTQGNTFRVMLVLLLATVVTIPILSVVQVLSVVLQGILMVWVDPMNPVFTVAVVAASGGVGAIANILLIPFWQVLKAVVYYDLKIRREGIDLSL